MRYILNENLILCGWKRKPFAIKNMSVNKAVALKERDFELLFMCSGKKDIDMEKLDDADKTFFENVLKEGVIREAKEGETRNLTYHQYKGRWKSSVQWSITGKCNYCCKHCFQSAPEGVLGEPTLDQCLYVLQQLNECGIGDISITGGEPLIRSDFYAILDEMKRLGMTLSTLYSNGKLVTDELLDELEKRDMKPSFQISFDGVGCHDWMRGVEGAEETALAAFRRLKERGYAASSAMCITKDNAPTVRQTVLKLAEVGCRSLKLQRCMPMGEWADQPEHYLDYDDALQLYLDYLPQYKEDGMPIPIQMEGFCMVSKDVGYRNLADRHGKEEILDSMPPCGVIESSLYIGPNGAVTPCMSMNGAAIESQFPNIFKMPLDKILTDSEYSRITAYRVKDVFEHTPKCRDCKYRTKCCAGCRAFAVGEEGEDYLGVDPVTCKILTEGWSDKLDEVATKLFGPQKTEKQLAEEEKMHEC